MLFVLIFIVFMYYFTCILFAIRPSGRKSAIKLIETSLGRRPDRDWVRSSVAPATAGSTNSARTISAHLLTCGEQPSSVVTLERRYGPRRLRDDDDDDDDDDDASVCFFGAGWA